MDYRSTRAAAFGIATFLFFLASVRLGGASTLSPALDVDAPVPTGQRGVVSSVATNGSAFLLTFTDGRSNDRNTDCAGGNAPCQKTDGASYAVLVAPTGIAANPVGIPIEQRAGASRAASDGTNFLVVAESETAPDFVHARRVSSAGVVLDSTPIVLDPSLRKPVVGFDGTNYLIVGGLTNLRGQFVSPSGALVGGLIDVGYGDASTITCGAGKCLVAWSIATTSSPASAQHAQARYVVGGAIQGGEFDLAVPTDYGTGPSVSFDGTDFVVFGAGAASSYGPLVATGQRAAAGSVPFTFATIAQSSQPVGYQAAIRAAWDGTRHLVAWTGGGNPTYARYVQSDGGVAAISGGPTNGVISGGPTGQPLACFPGTCFLAAGEDEGMPIYRVSGGSFLTASPERTTKFGNNERMPNVASDGTDYLVVWHDDRSRTATYTGEIRAARVDSQGKILDPSPLLLSEDSYAWTDRPPRVAFGGGRYLVTWTELIPVAPGVANYVTRAVRVTPAGLVEDATPLTLPVGSAPAVAFDGKNFLVVGSSSGQLVGTRVSPAGTILDGTPVVIATGTTSKVTPELVYDGTSYLLAWSDAPPSSAVARRLMATRVSPDAVALDFPYLTLAPSGTGNQRVPTLAASGGVTLVVWEDSRNDPANVSLYGVRLSGGKVLEDAFPVATHPTLRDDRASVGYSTRDGSFRVAWEQAAVSQSGPRTLRTAVIGTTGTVGPEEPLVESDWGDVTPSLPVFADGRPLLAYAEYEPSAPYGSFRAKVRLVGEPGDTGAGPDASTGDAAARDAADEPPIDGGDASPSGGAQCGCQTVGSPGRTSPSIAAVLALLAGCRGVHRRAKRDARRSPASRATIE